MKWVTRFFNENFKRPIFLYESLYNSYFKVQQTSDAFIESYKMKEENFNDLGKYWKDLQY
jgi:hypothetical protein